MLQRPDVRAELARLKDFQRLTAEYVHQRLYLDKDRTRRFLVADEVGLGKTMVARGVIAQAIDHLWDDVDRIDIVYVCSNAAIARQNLNRLQLHLGSDQAYVSADRLTLLAETLPELTARKLNFISFTPGTSFEMGKRFGTARERRLLYHLLRDAWDLRGVGPKNLFQGGVGRARWRVQITETPAHLEPSITQAFLLRINQHVGTPRKVRRTPPRDCNVARTTGTGGRDSVGYGVEPPPASCSCMPSRPSSRTSTVSTEFQRFPTLLNNDDDNPADTVGVRHVHVPERGWL